jgi:nucleotide-binding universal stress UspA family protein
VNRPAKSLNGDVVSGATLDTRSPQNRQLAQDSLAFGDSRLASTSTLPSRRDDANRSNTMLPRFQHILVPVDFTEKNLAALDVAFEMAVANHARVTLLHVVETMDVDSDAELEQFYATLQSRADSELERMAQRFVAAKIAVDRKIRFGKRLQEIVHDSADRKADLIVMSSHKPDLQNPTQTWATLSYQVSVLCPCPVLLVK